jgi:molybdenum cofactor biosynthesis enzyme MoaA
MSTEGPISVIPSLGICVTPACQMDCIYCPPNHENIFPASSLCDPLRVCDVIEAAARLHFEVIRFTGGEPLVDPERTRQLLQKTVAVGFPRIILNTNGVRLLEELPWLVEHKQRFVLIVSLDSVDREIFHRMTHLDACEKVMTGVIAAKQLGLRVRLNCVLTTENIQQFPDILTFAERHSIDVKVFDVFDFGGIFPDRWKRCFANIDSVISYLQDRYEPTAPERLPGERGINMLSFKLGKASQILVVQHHGRSRSTRLFADSCYSCPHHPCACGRFQIVVKSDGLVSPCRLRNDLGFSIQGKSYHEIADTLATMVQAEYSACKYK